MTNESPLYKDNLEKISMCYLGCHWPIGQKQARDQASIYKYFLKYYMYWAYNVAIVINIRKDNGNKFLKDHTLQKGQGSLKSFTH